MARHKDLCIMECGRAIVYARHGLCGACYSSIWLWTRKKSAAERKARLERLVLWSSRVNAVDDGTIRIQRAEEVRRTKRRR